MALASFLPLRISIVKKAILRLTYFETKLDKLLYELRYEINNRPTWVRVPLDALNRLVAPLNEEPTVPSLELGKEKDEEINHDPNALG